MVERSIFGEAILQGFAWSQQITFAAASPVAVPSGATFKANLRETTQTSSALLMTSTGGHFTRIADAILQLDLSTSETAALSPTWTSEGDGRVAQYHLDLIRTDTTPDRPYGRFTIDILEPFTDA